MKLHKSGAKMFTFFGDVFSVGVGHPRTSPKQYDYDAPLVGHIDIRTSRGTFRLELSRDEVSRIAELGRMIDEVQAAKEQRKRP